MKIQKKKLSVASQTFSTVDTPYLITDQPPIFMTNSLPGLLIVVLIDVTEDEIIQEAAEEALNAHYDREISIFYEEAKKKLSDLGNFMTRMQ